MKNKNLIDIIITTYNSEKYIEQLLDSILNQSFQDFKIIISDDNSQDSTKIILKKYSQNFPNKIKVFFNEKNIGITRNINKLLSIISSPYVACADHDDLWHKNKLEKQLNCLRNHPECVACYCDRQIINSENIIVLNSEYKKKGFKKSIIDFDKILKKKAPFSFNCLFFRNEPQILKKITPVPSKIIEVDYWLILFLSLLGGEICYIHKPLLKYRIHFENLSSNYFWMKNYNLTDLKKIYNVLISRQYKIKKDLKIIRKKFKEMGKEVNNLWNWENRLKLIILESSFWFFFIYGKLKKNLHLITKFIYL